MSRRVQGVSGQCRTVSFLTRPCATKDSATLQGIPELSDQSSTSGGCVSRLECSNSPDRAWPIRLPPRICCLRAASRWDFTTIVPSHFAARPGTPKDLEAAFAPTLAGTDAAARPYQPNDVKLLDDIAEELVQLKVRGQEKGWRARVRKVLYRQLPSGASTGVCFAASSPCR